MCCYRANLYINRCVLTPPTTEILDAQNSQGINQQHKRTETDFSTIFHPSTIRGHTMSTNIANTASLASLQAENTKLRADCRKLRETNAELCGDNVKYRHNISKLQKRYEVIVGKLTSAEKDNVRLREAPRSQNGKSLRSLLEHARNRIATQNRLLQCMEKMFGSEMGNAGEESEVLEGAELLAEVDAES